jgi:hypothetical protein
MAHDTKIPTHMPEAGYYYHYKHDPLGAIENYAYYIYGVGHHTESDCRVTDQFMQVYRPLYESAYVYQNGKLFDLRPLHMFYDPAVVKGVTVERFSRITDPDTLVYLKQRRARMYPEE